MEKTMLRNKDDIEYFSKLIFETVHIPVFYINKDLEVITGFPAIFTSNPIYSSYNELFAQLDFFNDQLNVPVLRTTNFQENFISIKVGKFNEFEGAWILGPSIYSPIVEETINGLLNDFQVRVSAESLKDYYGSLPVINKRTLLHSGLLATYLLYSKRLSVTDVIQKDTILTNNITKEANPDLQVSKNRQEISFHSSYEWEQVVMKCVKDGRKEDLINKLNLPDVEGRLGVLSKNSHFRSQKNLVISIITIATRYAIEGGLHPEMAYTMSDLYIQGLEDIKGALELQTYSREVLCDFTDRVNEAKHHKYTTPIIECQSYVFKHLYEEISLAKLAKVVNMHQNYLSTLFKKEVGISITEYILLQKVEEAKRLLIHSDYPLSEIYTWLNFHDQSHFTKVFKKYTGTTPKKFKTKKGE
ncbi:MULTISPECIES: helix-turn-helix domain-containing protein [Oceanobacillus]|uniref:helix-turn-helix domain-containing protein n=1 Tax=Oceanobacillus TaxID=182709 RepID=UPI000984D7C8|nr:MULTISPECIES: helix-turn-helix domain-containing protein [Oceanobacillus]MBT2599364.1 helix-turn-helix domain-containing protein [Oceanobacillus sp. ISL-74]MBT2652282.1 helix-turn-helix domain-containing protein [Oceanobacillus sp. ISL-73]